MELAKIKISDCGVIAHHNMPCAVCRKQPAVYFLNDATFHPCWACMSKGWRLIKKPKNRFLRWIIDNFCDAP